MWKVIFLFGFLLVAACATAGLLGGFEDAKVDADDVVKAAKEASRELSKRFGGEYHHHLLKVVKARRQVVAGTHYSLTIIVGKTTCKKSEVQWENVDGCDLQDTYNTYKKCILMVFRDLEDKYKIDGSVCLPSSKKEVLKM